MLGVARKTVIRSLAELKQSQITVWATSSRSWIRNTCPGSPEPDGSRFHPRNNKIQPRRYGALIAKNKGTEFGLARDPGSRHCVSCFGSH